jgi:hypothetical protein
MPSYVSPTFDCDCSEDYGPCENHCEVLAQREGASTRTADELIEVLCLDLIGCGAEVSPWGQDVLNRVAAALDDNRRMGVAWLPQGDKGDHMRRELVSLADQLESYVADLWVIHDDGYQIVKPSADCPLLADA